MDFQGPLYDVRMSRGQGYNSYIQEPRLYKAVKIEHLDRETTATKAETAQPNGVVNDANHTQAAPQSSPAPTGTDLVRLIIDELRKSNSLVPTVDSSKKLPYLKPTASGKPNQTVLFSSKQVKSASEIDMAMGSKASAAVKAASIGPGAELGSNISTSDDFKGDAINFLVTVKVVNEKDDKPEKWTFREVNKLKTRLSRIYCDFCRGHATEEEHPIVEDHATTPLSDKQSAEIETRQVIEREQKKPACHTCGHKRAIEFTRIYGDTFISDFVEGGEIYALVNIRSASKTKLKDLKAYASAQLTPAAAPIQLKADTEFTKSGKEAWDQAETSIRVQWRGGGEIKTHDFQWGLDSLIQVANAFPTFVAATSAKIRAVLTPYAALESFQRLQNIFPQHTLTLNYDRCALFVDTLYEDYKVFRSMWDELNTIIESPDKYIERQVDKRAHRDRALKGAGTGGNDPTALNRSPRSNSISSSNANSTRGPKFLSKLINKAAGAESSRKGSILKMLGQRTDTISTQAATSAEKVGPSNGNPEVEAMVASSVPQHGHGARRHPKFTRDEERTVEVAQSVSSVSGDHVPAPGHVPNTGNVTDSSAVPLTNLNEILEWKESEESKLVPLRPDETQKLSRLRLVCRFSMLHIQDLAANLVLDPQNTGSNFGRRDGGAPMFTQPQYPYPATIRAILPVKPDNARNTPDYGAWHYTAVEDLHFPDSMKIYPGSPYPDDYTYWWDVYGDALSDYLKYEHFQLGNFDPNNEEFPQAVAFQIHRPHMISSLDKKARNDENIISGIALRYNREGIPSPAYDDMENHKLNTKDKQKTTSGVPLPSSLFHDISAGKPPLSEKDWTPIMWTGETAAFNRLNIYHKQGSGRVAGLEIYRDDEAADGSVVFDLLKQGEPLISHKAWEGGDGKGKWSSGPPPPAYYALPGDGFSAQKLWMFAGFVGAFEKTGFLKGERALAKLAVIWKRRASQGVTVEV
jgi:hypothetical protein